VYISVKNNHLDNERFYLWKRRCRRPAFVSAEQTGSNRFCRLTLVFPVPKKMNFIFTNTNHFKLDCICLYDYTTLCDDVWILPVPEYW